MTREREREGERERGREREREYYALKHINFSAVANAAAICKSS